MKERRSSECIGPIQLSQWQESIKTTNAICLSGMEEFKKSVSGDLGICQSDLKKYKNLYYFERQKATSTVQ